ncbi:MAG: hypothetical protein ACSLFF_07650, partial [Solirubrobacterales bacterium]
MQEVWGHAVHYDVLNNGPTTDEDSASLQRLKAEAQLTFVWVGRLAAFAWFLGGTLATIYMVSTNDISTDSYAMLSLCALGFIASLIIPWSRAERWWVLPMIG